jgi:hypothetical protein
MVDFRGGRFSTIERDIEFVGELLSIERAAREIAVSNLQRGHPTAAVIRAQNNVFSFRVLLDVDFVKFDAALFEKGLGAAAVRAPACAVDCDLFHAMKDRALVRFYRDAAVFSRDLDTDYRAL